MSGSALFHPVSWDRIQLSRHHNKDKHYSKWMDEKVVLRCPTGIITRNPDIGITIIYLNHNFVYIPQTRTTDPVT